jgi:hypothetical protein
MAPMKKRAEKKSGMKKEMITVEVKNASSLRATTRGCGDLV